MTECISALGVPTMNMWLLQNLWVIFSACYITMYSSSPAESKLPTISFMCWWKADQLSPLPFMEERKSTDQNRKPLIWWTIATLLYTHTHTTSPFLSCKQTCIQLTSPLSSRHTERHVTFSSHFVFRLLLLWNFKKTYFVSTFCKEKKGER